MVFIHGSGFLIDSATRYGDISICNSLCHRNVIVVTIQSTGDETCPGNNGLWDQAMALQWIKATRSKPE
ncbi:Carboxylesterase family protein [Brugia pahangi]|uniref:COesterase domain-containing protein n=1 Tax=Brugia pahangi TaxID=6280 RepID=A0A0N4TX28_BRUPA|nr:unnamed protein product [Brugia pahangi]